MRLTHLARERSRPACTQRPTLALHCVGTARCVPLVRSGFPSLTLASSPSGGEAFFFCRVQCSVSHAAAPTRQQRRARRGSERASAGRSRVRSQGAVHASLPQSNVSAASGLPCGALSQAVALLLRTHAQAAERSVGREWGTRERGRRGVAAAHVAASQPRSFARPALAILRAKRGSTL